jgi:hypothetical protein
MKIQTGDPWIQKQGGYQLCHTSLLFALSYNPITLYANQKNFCDFSKNKLQNFKIKSIKTSLEPTATVNRFLYFATGPFVLKCSIIFSPYF